MVIDLSPPGWGTIENHDGDKWHLLDRYGDIFNIQYFHVDGSDNPYEFVLSNNGTDPTDNSILNPISSFDRIATYKLLELLVDSPEVEEIRVDPSAIKSMSILTPDTALSSDKIIVRGTLNADEDGLDNDGDGSADESDEASLAADNDLVDNDGDGAIDEPGELNRRDMDAWMQIITKTVRVSLIASINNSDTASTANWVDVPEWEESISSGIGVTYVPDGTKVRIESSVKDNVEFKILFNENEIEVGSLASDDPANLNSEYACTYS